MERKNIMSEYCKANAKAVFEKMKENGIIIRNMGDYLRITAGTKYENEKTVNTLKTVLEG